MAICTHTTDCGPLGEVELTISYRQVPKVNPTRLDMGFAEGATIYWIKVGGENGVEVNLADDYITDEIIPACVDDWNSAAQSAAEDRAARRMAAVNYESERRLAA